MNLGIVLQSAGQVTIAVASRFNFAIMGNLFNRLKKLRKNIWWHSPSALLMQTVSTILATSTSRPDEWWRLRRGCGKLPDWGAPSPLATWCWCWRRWAGADTAPCSVFILFSSETRRHTMLHCKQLKLFRTMQNCNFTWPTVMGKGWDFSSSIYGHFMSIVRESLLKRKEPTRLPSNLPSRQELFFWATLESSITGSWCWIIDDDDGRFAYR